MNNKLQEVDHLRAEILRNIDYWNSSSTLSSSSGIIIIIITKNNNVSQWISSMNVSEQLCKHNIRILIKPGCA